MQNLCVIYVYTSLNLMQQAVVSFLALPLLSHQNKYPVSLPNR